MPQDRFVRYTEKYGLPTDDANLIISSKEFSDFYDESVKINPDYKQISNLMLVELNRNLNDSEKTISDVTFSPADLAELVKMSTDGVVSKNAAKDILKIITAVSLLILPKKTALLWTMTHRVLKKLLIKL